MPASMPSSPPTTAPASAPSPSSATSRSASARAAICAGSSTARCSSHAAFSSVPIGRRRTTTGPNTESSRSLSAARRMRIWDAMGTSVTREPSGAHPATKCSWSGNCRMPMRYCLSGLILATAAAATSSSSPASLARTPCSTVRCASAADACRYSAPRRSPDAGACARSRAASASSERSSWAAEPRRRGRPPSVGCASKVTWTMLPPHTRRSGSTGSERTGRALGLVGCRGSAAASAKDRSMARSMAAWEGRREESGDGCGGPPRPLSAPCLASSLSELAM
mmetsp:Transcript_8136/g.25576  ORF Transcript_8136/g.25576 Transcript_8136/m.25576 type:complete len:281 (-) Transcript_8136:476-1318(-)